MVEMFIDPSFEILEFAEVHDEAVGIGLAAGKSQDDRPIVPVDKGAVACVQMLAMGKGDIAVNFFASEHVLKG